jgi:hypothetical protein
MSLLDFSDLEPSRGGRKKSFKTIIGIGAIAGVVVLGSTLAASINLNGGGPVEFGQGVTQATACDSEILITPYSSFVNGNPGEFKFSGVMLSQVDITDQDDSSDEGCAGKTFLIKLYKANNDLIGTSYTISVESDGSFSSPDGELVTSGGTSRMASGSSEQVTLTFTDPAVAATDVYTITIESSIEEDVSSVLVFGNEYLSDLISFNGFEDDELGILFKVPGQSYRFVNNDGLMAQVRSNDSSITFDYTSNGEGVVIDDSDLVVIDGAAYGNIIATFTFEIDGKDAQLRNIYHLVRGKSFIKITSTLTNTDTESTLTNLSLTVGNNDTRVEDDMVYFTRGTISGSGFDSLANIADRSNTVMASRDGINQLLFSKSLVSNSKWIENCCEAGELADKNPGASAITSGEEDGSMALDFSVSDLAPGESYTFTWMFGGATDAELSRVVRAMFNAAAADSYSP